MINKIKIFYLLIIFLLPSVYALLSSGFFLSDDGLWMVIRFSAFYQALSDGQFPVRFLGRLNFGYGYPVANFLYPGFMYLAVPFQVLGLGFVNSIKIIMIASLLGGGIFTYFWLSKIFDRPSALLGGIFYTYSPYHLFDLYKRGSVGEILSLMFVPFILWAIEKKNKFLIAVGIFFLAISHNSLFLLFAPLLFAYAIVRKKIDFKNCVISFGLGILMSSFFIVPAIVELTYTNFSKIKISEVGNYFVGLEVIGVSSIVVLIAGLLLFLRDKSELKKMVLLFIILSIVSIFLSLKISSLIWAVLPASLIQFPFRTLSYLVLSSSFLSAYILFSLRKKIIIFSVLTIAVFLSSLPNIMPKTRFDADDSFYSTNEATTTVRDEYMPRWVLEKPTSHFSQKVEILDGTSLPSNLTYDSKRMYFETSETREAMARINTIYYPGWQAEINGIKTNIMYDNGLGVMEIKLPKGENRVELEFRETPLRLFSDFLSIISFILLVIWNRKSGGENEKN